VLAHVRFPGSSQVEGSNLLIDFADMEKTEGSVNIQLPDGIELLGEKRNLMFNDVTGSLRLHDGIAEASKLKAQVLGGPALVNLRGALSGKKPWYESTISIENVSMNALKHWLLPEDDKPYDGTFDLDFTGKGTGKLQTIVGSGRVVIDSDEPVAQSFPVLDGLVGFLENIIPVLKDNKAWTLDMPYSVKDGNIIANEGKLNGPSIKTTVNGQVDLINDKADVNVSVNLRGLIGVATNLLTPFRDNLIEIKGTGSLGDVKWERAGRNNNEPPPAKADDKEERKPKPRGILKGR
jgi:hypothetical protein